ncbi:hypothetical protein [Streptomyces sp. x-80]|uniref:hypothetical protein n=1 Tax=Streptomyces sp. x-80 TaxID=2789282 RepID=UPI00398067C7
MYAGKRFGSAVLCGAVVLGGSVLASVPAGAAQAPGKDFDVSSYKVKLDYRPEAKELSGITDINAKADQDLDTLRLGLVFPTESVEVDGVKAGFETNPDDPYDSSLTVRPARKIERGQEFTVRVKYAGAPEGARLFGTTDGGLMSMENTPWFASHAGVMDRASLKVSATVPAGWSAMSNGTKTDTEHTGDRDTYHWATTQDLDALKESVISIGPWEIEESRLKDGKPVYTAYGKGLKAKAAPYVAKQQEIIDFLAQKFGTPYPFSSLGTLFAEPADENYPFLATQGRVHFSAPLQYWDEPAYAHEWTHQWFGMAVSGGDAPADAITTESVAQYAAWLWDEHNGKDIDARYRSEILERKDDAKWWADNTLDGMGAYSKGSYFLHALRHQIGAENFDAVLKKWQTENAGEVRGWEDMARMFTQVSGQDLTEFFAQWRGDKVPEDKYLMPGTLPKP